MSPVLAPGSWGEYECKASNRLGHASATTSITGDHLGHDHDSKQEIVLKAVSKPIPGWADEASVSLSPLASSTSSHLVGFPDFLSSLSLGHFSLSAAWSVCLCSSCCENDGMELLALMFCFDWRSGHYNLLLTQSLPFCLRFLPTPPSPSSKNILSSSHDVSTHHTFELTP